MNTLQLFTLAYVVFNILLLAALAAAAIYLFWLVTRALKTYIRSKEVRQEKKVMARTLGEALKENRLRCQMTQEFVAETLGVSRQAVSKWENGTSDPNTSNLLALAKLYHISPEELLKCVQTDVQETPGENP